MITAEGGAALPAFLDDSAAAQYAFRGALTRYGRAAVNLRDFDAADASEIDATDDATDDDGDEAEALDEPIELLVIEAGADFVRVVDEHYDIRLAVYIPRDDLAERNGAPVRVSPTPSPATDDRVVLASGAPVELRERRGAWVRTSVTDEGVTITGWIPTSQLSRVYRLAEHDPAEFADTLKFLESTSVYDRPGGTVLAEIHDGEAFERIGRRVGDGDRDEGDGQHVEIEVVTPRLRVRGFVPAHAVQTKAPDSDIWGGLTGGGAWSSTHTNWLAVDKGTQFMSAPDGLPFAIAVDASHSIVLRGDSRDGWAEVGIETPWGRLTGWVECPALRSESGSGSTFRCTHADDPNRIKALPAW